MSTAVDTNVLLDVLRPNPDFVERWIKLLEDSARAGPIVMCDLVYAELAASCASRVDLDAFLQDNLIRSDAPSSAALFVAGRAWRAYRTAGGTRQRIISDFLIGAHAQVQASRLATRDRGFYRRYFEDLIVVEP